MLKKQVLILFVVLGLFAEESSIKAMDPEEIKHYPAQTQNGKGANFNSLGAFEEEFMREGRGLELSESNGIGNILFMGEAYGRLPMRVLRVNPFGLSTLFVNELSLENLRFFIEKLGTMQNSSSLQEVQEASRVKPIVGDCLQLPLNSEFTGSFADRVANGHLDLIMCANVLHFFDGAQVLDFFINAFNFLKPGGSAYVFTQSRIPNFTSEEIRRCGHRPSYKYMQACFDVMDAAKLSNIFFPGLIDDNWLMGKTSDMDSILRQKPNGLCVVNYIPARTLLDIAEGLGFEVRFSAFYQPATIAHSVSMIRDIDGEYCGLILTKPRAGYVTRENLDAAFVRSCLQAKDVMQTFVRGLKL